MVIGIFVFLVLAALIAGCGVWIFKSNEDMYVKEWGNSLTDEQKAHNSKLKKNIKLAIVCICILSIGVITLPFSFHTVDATEVAVVRSLGKIKDVRSSGTSFDFWMTNSYSKYDTKVQEVNLDDMAYSSDAQQMTLNIKFQYQIIPDKVIDIAKQYGSLKTLENRITPVVRDKVKSVLSKSTAMNIISTRESLSGTAFEAVKEALDDTYFVNITGVAITNIDFSDQFEKAVEEKMVAEQKQLKAEYENATKIAKAEAEAKAKILAAEGTAKANELLQKTLTDKVLQEMYINKWDGKLPQVVAGEETGIMIPSLGNSEEKK